MQVIRLVPKGEWQLPVTCACGTQVAIEQADIHRFEEIGAVYDGKWWDTIQSSIRLGECPGCGWVLEATEQRQHDIGYGRLQNIPVVQSKPLQKALADGAQFDGFRLLPRKYLEEREAAKAVKKAEEVLAKQALKKLTKAERDALANQR